MYREIQPPAALAGVVRCLWQADRPAGKLIVPDGCIDLIVGPDRAFVAGPDTGPWLTNRGGPLHAFRFHPGAAPRVLGVPADELADQRIDLADLWGRAVADRLVERPADAAAVVARRVHGTRDHALDHVLARLDAGVRVGTAADEAGLSARQLRRRFTAAVGYGPAIYLRVARLQRALELAPHVGDLARLAAEAGYADQPHLNRDCRELTGQTPARFLGDRFVQAAAPRARLALPA
ncbi:helix-turn-helix transcriptional regulator [Amycolatopsis suaedae]|uniref:AraC family transcriptional regulator n=1 Tax=Amycolatopsis suaedae TaxID=2510978 RepID=A0A4Q7J739_9PSEU|nr:helix-turn-helix transcriptional regulator [Amycolatopsis suaedae]RZQ62977.1 AraC family transcriptional regulator [Amycolatopsis suaedae]